ncbi:DUF5686 family protein [uncultured Chryseobacterium sp.]|uniref:DUF5686 family protein n=1 Tax=uncultured Chryseobacterium sp. TaxID=259322 RepID=UPI002623576C|nr:DUF5686 family protein [uncultured Chryseobacterium sp.]
MKTKLNITLLITVLFATFAFAQNTEKELQEVVLRAKEQKFKNKKENPAYAIMQEVWKRKRKNGLENFNTYRFDEYEKIEFDLNNIDSAFMEKKVFNKMDFIFDYADSTANGKLALPLFLNEAVYKNFGTNQPEKKTKRELIAQKTSGFQDNEIIALTAKNLYKEINIYDNTLNFFNIGFQSPVSTDGFSTYDYNLIEDFLVKGEDCYRIQYEPKRKDVLAFRGFLYISKDTYAVVKATLRSTKKMNINFVNGVVTDLEYDNPDSETFLPSRTYTEFDLALTSKNKNSKGMVAKRTVNYTHYEFNQPIEAKIFDNKEEANVKTLAKDETFWENARVDSLSRTEQGVYDMLDKLQKVPRFNNMVKLYETLASGYYNVGNAIDIGDLYSTFGFNDVEGTRIRLGARTYFSQNDPWRIQGYGAYGFKDNQFKYGAEAKYLLNKNTRFIIGAGTRRDIMQLGVQLTNDDGIMSRSFASSSIFSTGSNTSLSSVNQTNVFGSIEPWKNFQVRLDGTMQSIKSANEEKFNLYYYDLYNQLRKTVLDTHLTLSLIARPGAKFSQTGVDRYEHSTLSPTFVLKYTRGIEGLFNADFGYNKLQLMYFQPILLGTWGKTLISFEAGKNFDTVPLALQNVIPGNQSYSLVPNTFAQLNYYEFVADTYSTLHLEHHFNGKILSYIPLIKKLKFREVAFLRGAYGTLSQASKDINVEGFKYSAPSDKIYYEYGFGIENIGLGNLRIFRVDFNWRGNYLENPDAKKFGVKAGFQMNF